MSDLVASRSKNKTNQYQSQYLGDCLLRNKGTGREKRNQAKRTPSVTHKEDEGGNKKITLWARNKHI
jgi:hypothetical protein